MRTIPRHLCRSPLLLLTLCSLAACNDPVGEDTPYAIVPITTAALSGTPGMALADTLVVEVRDAEGHPVPGAKVTWSLPQGGSLEVQAPDAASPMTGTADDRGRNYAVWTLGLPEGTQEARVVPGVTGTPASFEATATALHASAVAVGLDYACAIRDDQVPVCWGENSHGQLGTGDLAPRDVPTPVQGLTVALELAASSSAHTCAVNATHEVWCWGRNYAGQAGSAAAQPDQVAPVAVPGTSGASALTLGNSFTCAVFAVDGAHCWGSNDNFRMGTGDPVHGQTSTPLPVIGGADFTGFGLDWDRGCAVDSAWELWCWGNGGSGEFSPAASQIHITPVQAVAGSKFSSSASNLFTTCGIGLGGPALCFGVNVGLGNESGPVHTIGPVVVLNGVSFARIVTDGGRFYGASTDGRLYLWGVLDCCGGSPAIPGEVPLPIRIIDVAAGDYGYCVIAETGGLYCDPYNDGKDGLEAFPAP